MAGPFLPLAGYGDGLDDGSEFAAANAGIKPKGWTDAALTRDSAEVSSYDQSNPTGAVPRQLVKSFVGEEGAAPAGDGINVHPGGGNSSEFNDEFGDETVNRAKTTEDIFRYLPQQGRGQGAVFQGEGENFLPIGGPEGKASFDRAYVSGPRKLAQAMEDSGEAQVARADAMSAHYGQEAQREKDAMAAMQARRQQDLQELQVRQQNLDATVQAYSNDLQDQGKFWRNPGNIVSAVAFSLMPIFSNDPAIGIKLINQAVDRDMANRQHEANMHLGELRSNLAGYHKLAGDRQAGDLLAQSEAHRIAAIEVERIAQSFESPIAKARAMAIVQDQNVRSEVARQQAYKRDVYNPVRAVQPGADAKWRGPGKAGVQGAWKEFDLPGKDWSGAAVNGVIAGTPSVASSGKPSPGGAYVEYQKSQLASKPSAVAEAALELPHGPQTKASLTDMFERMVAKRAAALTNINSPNYAKEYNEHVDKLRTAADVGVAEIAKAAQPFRVGIAVTTRMQRDMDIIENECKKAGVNPNKFLGDLRNLTGAPLAARINDLRSRYSSPDGQHDQERLAMLQASERFHSTLAGQVVDYYHDMAGAAQNAKELENLAVVISGHSSWEKIRTFVHNRSQDFSARLQGAITHSPDPISATLYMAQYGNGKSAATRLPSSGIAPPARKSPESFQRGPMPQERGGTSALNPTNRARGVSE